MKCFNRQCPWLAGEHECQKYYEPVCVRRISVPESEQPATAPVDSQASGSVLNVVITYAIPTTMGNDLKFESLKDYIRANPDFVNGYLEDIDIKFK